MNISEIREAASRAIHPIKSLGFIDNFQKFVLFKDRRIEAGRRLPDHYLVYLLLVDLLSFHNIGTDEKVAWSIPIAIKGELYLIELQKFGLRLLGPDCPDSEKTAGEVVGLINKGVSAAQPYFVWLAEQAFNDSKVNVLNRSPHLYDQFTFFNDLYESKRAEVERRSKEEVVTCHKGGGKRIEFPVYRLRREAHWLAVSAIESFFSWTEHIFIHLFILQGTCVTGDDVRKLTTANWNGKFKKAIGIDEPKNKHFYDELTAVRRQYRNFITHGAFGQHSEFFQFHSSAGPIPVNLDKPAEKYSYRLTSGFGFPSEESGIVDIKAIGVIRDFIEHIWSGPLAPARIYLETGLDLILTFAQNGEYVQAMTSEAEMQEYTNFLVHVWECMTNMEFENI